MKLFIGNTTQQAHIFTYRRFGQKVSEPSRVTIPAGSQISIPDLDADDVRDIIDQHRAFGFCTVKEAQHNPAYRGLIYSEDISVKFHDLANGVQDTHEKLKKEGAKTRKKAAETIAGRTMATTKGKRNKTQSLEVSISADGDHDAAPSSFSQETYAAAGD